MEGLSAFMTICFLGGWVGEKARRQGEMLQILQMLKMLQMLQMLPEMLQMLQMLEMLPEM